MRQFLTFVAIVGSLATQAAWADSCLIDPVKIPQNLVTSVFGKSRELPQYNGQTHIHWGVDFQARDPSNRSVGADLLAVDNGTVIGAGYWGSGYGNRVALKRDNGDIVMYSHLAKVEPKLKSGGAIGFKDGGGVGSQRVAAGERVGVAGGTADHRDTNQRAIHLHLEYITDFSADKDRDIRGAYSGTRSRYLRNAVQYMCKAPAHAPGAGTETASAGGNGTPPVPAGGSLSANKGTPASDDQAAEAVKAQPSVAENERYGMPDAPPYADYAGMSESQIVEAEMLRRALDTEWETRLTEWGPRGLWMEITRMRGVKLWLESRLAEKSSRIEAMLSIKLAYNTNKYLNPRVSEAYSLAQGANASAKVK